MADQLWAHSKNDHGLRHSLPDHLRGTAGLARVFGGAFGAGELAAYLALRHDVGKGSCSWQQRLLAVDGTRESVGIDHKRAGTWLALPAAGPLAACILGHHGGLPAWDALTNELRSVPGETIGAWESTAARVAELVPEISASAPASFLPAWAADPKVGGPSALDLLARMVFSTLVDADFLDTE